MKFLPFVYKRWLRTFPTTVGAILFMYMITSTFHGPVGRELREKHVGNCRESWIYTLLYINNWQVFNDICLPQTWSQSVDLQLWILSYFPLIWLVKKPKLGVWSCIAMIILGVTIPSFVMYIYDLPRQISGRPVDIIFFILHGSNMARMHFHPYNNMSSYFVGILLGYCCATNRRVKPVKSQVITMSSVYKTVFRP